MCLMGAGSEGETGTQVETINYEEVDDDDDDRLPLSAENSTKEEVPVTARQVWNDQNDSTALCCMQDSRKILATTTSRLPPRYLCTNGMTPPLIKHMIRSVVR